MPRRARRNNRIDILASKSTSERHSTNKGSGGSVGVSFGTSGLLFNIGANGSRGKSDGTDTSYTNSHVSAGKTVNIQSGGDTTIRGGVIEADRVTAKVGGDLKIESLQDTSTSTSKPLYGWLVFDFWQWEPLGRSLKFVLLGATGGVVAGAFFTNYEWLIQTHSTTLRKVITTALVVATCIFVVVMAREHAGRLLPG